MIEVVPMVVPVIVPEVVPIDGRTVNRDEKDLD